MSKDYIPNEYKNKAEEIMREMYKLGYKDGISDGKIKIEEAYNNGLNAAWEAARKLFSYVEDGGFAGEQIREIFGEPTMPRSEIFNYYSVDEVIKKIKEYESHLSDKDVGEIKIGDEVIGDKEKGVVTRMTPYEVTVLNTTGGGIIFTKRKNVKKTGKHYPQITEVLEQMKGDSDDCLECVKYAPTIIEADIESEDKE